MGHLYIIGGPRSGRSQALRTIAGSLARSVSARDMHVYGIDCGNGALLPMTKLPHCGAVVARTQQDRAQRLMTRLLSELSRRMELLGSGGFADITEQRASATGADRLPHLVLMLDRWEGFMSSLGELDSGKMIDDVIKMLHEGASVGMHLMISGDRQLLSGRLSSLTEEKLVLRLPDRTDFTLAGLSPRNIPEQLGEGRGFRADTGTETQIALLDEDLSGQAQAAALERIAAAAKARDVGLYGGQRPFRVDVLPARVTFEECWSARPLEKELDCSSQAGLGGAELAGHLWAMIGLGGDDLIAYGADLGTGAPTFVVGGPARSGRSTMLVTMAESLLRSRTEVVLAAPRPSPLRQLAGRPGVRAVFTGEDLFEEELAEAFKDASPVVMLVDDAELLRECSAQDYLRSLVRDARDDGRGIVIAGIIDQVCSGFGGWQVDMRKNRHGMLLSPQDTMASDLIGVRLSRGHVGNSVIPGRGIFHDGSGELLTVQTSLPPQAVG